jgi:hypothetical protein
MVKGFEGGIRLCWKFKPKARVTVVMADRNPLWCCHECVAKLWVATGADPVKRYTDLAAFCSSNNLKSEAVFFTKAADAIGQNAATDKHR